MARSKDPITQADLAAFVADDSDFSLEMQVLLQLRNIGFRCEHSGTYRDPVTEKIRQFDIRAVMDHDNYTLVLAVECKNLRLDHPLLISAVPRSEDEAFHNLAIHEIYPSGFRHSTVRHIDSAHSVYKPGEMVGKKTDQVAKDDKGNYSSDDRATFEKLNQALNSCQDLIQRFVTKASPPLIRAVVPVLAVPSGLLWQVDYLADGRLQTPPRQVSHTTLFVDHPWRVEQYMPGELMFHLSHIELVTLDSLTNVSSLWISNGFFF